MNGHDFVKSSILNNNKKKNFKKNKLTENGFFGQHLERLGALSLNIFGVVDHPKEMFNHSNKPRMAIEPPPQALRRWLRLIGVGRPLISFWDGLANPKNL